MAGGQVEASSPLGGALQRRTPHVPWTVQPVFCAETPALIGVLRRGVLPKTRASSLQLITSGEHYQLCGIDFVASPRPQFDCFCASMNFGEGNFRGGILCLGGLVAGFVI